MENEIKVGEYVRTDEGEINRITEILNDDSDVLTYYCFENNMGALEKSIVKHSPNLIDILECGDYINGHKIVNEIWGEDDNNLYFEIEGGYNKARYIGENEIKEVVAKEQFESISYKVTKM